jgi:hypothetical protein
MGIQEHIVFDQEEDERLAVIKSNNKRKASNIILLTCLIVSLWSLTALSVSYQQCQLDSIQLKYNTPPASPA